MTSKMKPTIVLATITTIVAALLIVTYNLTYVDTSNVLTDKLKNACVEVFGEGEYELISDWKAAGFAIEKPENVEKLIKKSDGSISFEVITSGYAKNGIDLVIGIDKDGKVAGISVVALGETPGLGTKVNDSAFLNKFDGANSSVSIVKTPSDKQNEIQAVTSATYSSKGVAKAVNVALETYAQLGAGGSK